MIKLPLLLCKTEPLPLIFLFVKYFKFFSVLEAFQVPPFRCRKFSGPPLKSPPPPLSQFMNALLQWNPGIKNPDITRSPRYNEVHSLVPAKLQ